MIAPKVCVFSNWSVLYPLHAYLFSQMTKHKWIRNQPVNIREILPGKHEHASLNQCQLIAANRPKLMLCAPPAGGGDKVSVYM